MLNIWFWSRQDTRIPKDVKNGAASVNPAAWGKPTATWNNNACQLQSKLGPNRNIINLTFCAYTELIDLGNVLTILYRR